MIRDVTVYEVVSEAARLWPDGLALTSGDRSWTLAELLAEGGDAGLRYLRLIDRLQADVGSNIELERVLLVGGEGSNGLRIGAPVVEGAKVTAQVVSHDLGEKRDIFRYRRTRRTRRGMGFRPSQTTLTIQEITA